MGRPSHIPNGVRLRINIHVRDGEAEDVAGGERALCDRFEDIFQGAIRSGQLVSALKKCWALATLPELSNLSVFAVDSKKKIKRTETMLSQQRQSQMSVEMHLHADTENENEDEKEGVEGDVDAAVLMDIEQ